MKGNVNIGLEHLNQNGSICLNSPRGPTWTPEYGKNRFCVDSIRSAKDPHSLALILFFFFL